MEEIDGYQYSSRVYDVHKVSRGHKLGVHLATTSCSYGVYSHPYSPVFLFGRVASPWIYSRRCSDILLLFERIISPGS